MFGNSLSNHKKAPRKWGFFVEKSCDVAMYPGFTYDRGSRCSKLYKDDSHVLHRTQGVHAHSFIPPWGSCQSNYQ